MLRILPPSLSLTGITTILFVIFHAMNIHFQYPLATTFSVVKLQKIIAEVLMTPHVMQIFLARFSLADAWLIVALLSTSEEMIAVYYCKSFPRHILSFTPVRSQIRGQFSKTHSLAPLHIKRSEHFDSFCSSISGQLSRLHG